MSYFLGKEVLITGATQGIGFALTDTLAEQGALVIGVARDQAKLRNMEMTYAGRFKGFAMDVSEKSEWLRLQSALKDLPEIFILNAGNCEYLENGVVDSELVSRLMKVNFMANVYAAEVFLMNLQQVPSRQWVVVSSSASFFAMPRGEAYGASKAALTYFFEALSLSYPAVSFSIVNPGFVKTPLTDKNDFPMPMLISPESAAKYILKGIERRKSEINFPPLFTFIMKLLGKLPAVIRKSIGRRMINA